MAFVHNFPAYVLVQIITVPIDRAYSKSLLSTRMKNTPVNSVKLVELFRNDRIALYVAWRYYSIRNGDYPFISGTLDRTHILLLFKPVAYIAATRSQGDIKESHTISHILGHRKMVKKNLSQHEKKIFFYRLVMQKYAIWIP